MECYLISRYTPFEHCQNIVVFLLAAHFVSSKMFSFIALVRGTSTTQIVYNESIDGPSWPSLHVALLVGILLQVSYKILCLHACEDTFPMQDPLSEDNSRVRRVHTRLENVCESSERSSQAACVMNMSVEPKQTALWHCATPLQSSPF
jgi:hypothetical protein